MMKWASDHPWMTFFLVLGAYSVVKRVAGPAPVVAPQNQLPAGGGIGLPPPGGRPSGSDPTMTGGPTSQGGGPVPIAGLFDAGRVFAVRYR